jgi:hypothetical protein
MPHISQLNSEEPHSPLPCKERGEAQQLVLFLPSALYLKPPSHCHVRS